MSDFKLTDLVDEEVPEQKPEKKKKIKWIIVIVGVILALVLAVNLPDMIRKWKIPHYNYGFACDYLDEDYGYYCGLENGDDVSIYYDEDSRKVNYISYSLSIDLKASQEESIAEAERRFLEYQQIIAESDALFNDEKMVTIAEPFADFETVYYETREGQNVYKSYDLDSHLDMDVSYYYDSNRFYICITSYSN